MKIVTSVVNNPIFIEIQYHTLNKYIKGNFEFIVFNDAKPFSDKSNYFDVTMRAQIEETCKRLNIRYVNIPNDHHKYIEDGGSRCVDALHFILKYQIENPDKYLLIDSDMFLIDYFDLDKFSNYECAVVLQSRNNFKTNYIWNGLYYFDMTKMKNIDLLNWNFCPGCDVGGMMESWLNKQLSVIPSTDEIRWTDKCFHTKETYLIKHLWSCTWDMSELPENLKNHKKLITFFQVDPRNVNGKFYCEIYENSFLHYRAGSNWAGEGQNLHNILSNMLKCAIMEDMQNH